MKIIDFHDFKIFRNFLSFENVNLTKSIANCNRDVNATSLPGGNQVDGLPPASSTVAAGS